MFSYTYTHTAYMCIMRVYTCERLSKPHCPKAVGMDQLLARLRAQGPGPWGRSLKPAEPGARGPVPRLQSLEPRTRCPTPAGPRPSGTGPVVHGPEPGA